MEDKFRRGEGNCSVSDEMSSFVFLFDIEICSDGGFFFIEVRGWSKE